MKHTISGLAVLISLIFIPGLAFAQYKTECDASNYLSYVYRAVEHRCYLSGEYLAGVNLTEANLRKANLEGAVLERVKGLSPEQRDYAREQGAYFNFFDYYL